MENFKSVFNFVIRNIIFYGLILGICSCTKNDLNLPLATMVELDKRQEGLYLKSTGQIFTGYLIEYYPSGEADRLHQVENINMKSRSLIENGKLNGLSEGWYPSGKKQIEEYFVNGKSHGIRIKWFSNGVKSTEDKIENGVLNGTCRKWHKNGQLAEEINMVDGNAEGTAYSWYADGSKKAEVQLKMGKVIEQKFSDVKKKLSP